MKTKKLFEVYIKYDLFIIKLKLIFIYVLYKKQSLSSQNKNNIIPD